MNGEEQVSECSDGGQYDENDESHPQAIDNVLIDQTSTCCILNADEMTHTHITRITLTVRYSCTTATAPMAMTE